MNRNDLKPEDLVRFAVYPLVVLVAGGVFVQLLSQLGALDVVLMFLLFCLASPLAYLIRNTRRGQALHHASRRGAERTPVLPHDHEEEP